MSQAEIDLIKTGFAAFNEGDFKRMLNLWDGDVEVERLSGAGTLRGKEAIRAWLSPDALEYQRGEPTEFRANGERVLVTCDWTVRGSESGIEVDSQVFLVFTVRTEKVIRVEVYLDEPEAIEAAGLRV